MERKTLKKPYTVGITGGSASGKTTFIRKLQEHFTEKEICVISQDHYYRPFSEQLKDANGEVNFDLPEAIDFRRLQRDVRSLQNGKVVELVEYTFNDPKKFPQKMVFSPTPVLIVEGHFILSYPKLAAMFDLKLFIDADEDLKLTRRLKRDVRERGMSHEQVLYQWEQHVKPSDEKYLLQSREQVDIIILNNTDPLTGELENSCKLLVSHFRNLMK